MRGSPARVPQNLRLGEGSGLGSSPGGFETEGLRRGGGTQVIRERKAEGGSAHQ